MSGSDDHEQKKTSGAKGSVTPRMLIMVTKMGSWGPVTTLVETEGLFWLFTFIYLCVCEWVSVCLGVGGIHLVREHLVQVNFLLPLWVPGVEPPWLGLAAGMLSHKAILPA